MKYLFWILWGIELGFMLWWLFDELKLKYLTMNPSVYLGFFWLILALVFKLMMKSETTVLYMVGIPGALLAIMGLLIGMYVLLK